jgi:hypothetical protein
MVQPVTVVTHIQITGANPYILVTSEQAGLIMAGWRKPMPVLVRINDDTKVEWQTNMMPNGNGDFYFYLHGDMRLKSKTKVGDTITVNLRFHDAYRNGPLHRMPGWFENALNKNPSAMTNWNNLPPSRQKEILRYFDGLRSDEAKIRNVARAIDVLEGNNGHFMGRDWANGK